jgi:hypothetical protein
MMPLFALQKSIDGLRRGEGDQTILQIWDGSHPSGSWVVVCLIVP